MTRFLALLSVLLYLLPARAQTSANAKYWVFLTDKKGVSFSPETYFDQKTIADRVRRGLPVSDQTDWPVSERYVQQLAQLSDSVTFASRWFNAVVCYATPAQLRSIKKLPYVRAVQAMEQQQVQLAQATGFNTELSYEQELIVRGQLASLQGGEFAKKGLDGSGIRIAVFDAGFKSVDTNPAFNHLRRRSAILKTWDFVRQREFVYSYSSHGTQVLSCIAGDMAGKQMGLATGAEFLLARTERQLSERFSEEENWVAAMEWAHKHGANIINSSLGYTNERYFRSQMDGRYSMVTRAANMAARKGMLIVNSAGNEGSGDWKVMGAPADADSVLSIGGIRPASGFHTSFSSFGPTADKRLKPNVCAYGHVVASGPDGFGTTEGTSFSSPLVAGFAACAWQARPGISNMQLFKEIEKSASLFPYFDYAHGYGLPQAGYFTGADTAVQKPTFEIVEKDYGIQIRIKEGFIELPDTTDMVVADTAAVSDTLDIQQLLSGLSFDMPEAYTVPDYFYYHIENSRGYLDKYYVLEATEQEVLSLVRSDIAPGKKVRFHYKGYTASYQF